MNESWAPRLGDEERRVRGEDPGSEAPKMEGEDRRDERGARAPSFVGSNPHG